MYFVVCHPCRVCENDVEMKTQQQRQRKDGILILKHVVIDFLMFSLYGRGAKFQFSYTIHVRTLNSETSYIFLFILLILFY